MIAYKVLRNEELSAIIFSREVKYPLNEWTQTADGSLLFCFSSLEHASDFFIKQGHTIRQTLNIFEIEIDEDPITPKSVLNTWFLGGWAFTEFWKDEMYRLHPSYDRIFLGDPPAGTLLAKRVKVLRKINYEDRTNISEKTGGYVS